MSKTTAFLVLLIITIIIGASLTVCYVLKGESNALKQDIVTLQTEKESLNKQLETEKQNNTELYSQAFPRIFNTWRELDRWARDNAPVRPGEYYSEDAIRMLNIARKEGIWMGLVPVLFNEYTKTFTLPTKGGGWLFCEGIITDGSVYLIDPATGDNMYLQMFQAEFKWDKLPSTAKKTVY